MKILKLLAKTKGITIQDLAKQSGMSQGTLHHLMSKRSTGHRSTLTKIASVLGVPVAFLLVTDEMATACEKGIYRALKVVIAQNLMQEVSGKP